MAESSTSGLKVEVNNHEDVVVVKPLGRVIRENQDELRTQLERLISDGVSRIALNLETVDYMDSAGFGCCSYIYKLVSERPSGAVAVFGATRNLAKTWSLLRLETLIPLFTSETETLEWLRRQS
ncbi:hypothetical protein BV582_22630 [Bacillus paralicheniformis]|uniref:STAS domain-containing protein n=1 Tax=uncultured organism TaxID=155900 RepID=A0A6G7MAB9_9ZZZZ|nr:hypothetical protein BV582_22630 [Bacillus paralicheniformis]QIJ31409.1 STAS domain-containing protein [uncultured organism]